MCLYTHTAHQPNIRTLQEQIGSVTFFVQRNNSMSPNTKFFYSDPNIKLILKDRGKAMGQFEII